GWVLGERSRASMNTLPASVCPPLDREDVGRNPLPIGGGMGLSLYWDRNGVAGQAPWRPGGAPDGHGTGSGKTARSWFQEVWDSRIRSCKLYLAVVSSRASHLSIVVMLTDFGASQGGSHATPPRAAAVPIRGRTPRVRAVAARLRRGLRQHRQP